MTAPSSKRPSVLLVGPRHAGLAPRLRAAGFDLIRTNSRAAAIAYGNQLAPDFVLTDARTALVLCGCYPDGPFWIRRRLDDELVVLHGCDVDPATLERFANIVSSAQIAA